MPLNELEETCIEQFRSGAGSPPREKGATADWIGLGLEVLLTAGRMLRANRYVTTRDTPGFKTDGTPTTRLESEIEQLLRKAVAAVEPSTTVVGEETGGTLPTTGLAVAMDPVDGTWAFVSGTENFATTIAAFRDGVPFLGMVMNPTTGEIGYAAADQRTRLVHLSVFGEPDTAYPLPIRIGQSTRVLVNVHPSRTATGLIGALYEAWQEGGIQFVRSPGGSPSWALLEAAKGRFVYVNMWGSGTAPYDLAAGVLLVRGSGGEVVDLDGQPINALNHEAPFVAGVDAEARQQVIEIARGVVVSGE